MGIIDTAVAQMADAPVQAEGDIGGIVAWVLIAVVILGGAYLINKKRKDKQRGGK